MKSYFSSIKHLRGWRTICVEFWTTGLRMFCKFSQTIEWKSMQQAHSNTIRHNTQIGIKFHKRKWNKMASKPQTYKNTAE